MGVAEDVMAQYPTLRFLLGDPEVGSLLTQAVDPNAGFSPQTFQAKLMETTWWKSQTAEQRKWQIEAATDPASANLKRYEYGTNLEQVGREMGVFLSGPQLAMIQEWGLQTGIAPDSQVMRRHIMTLSDPNAVNLGFGEAGVAAQQVYMLAKGSYFYDMPQFDAIQHGRDIAIGHDTLESIDARMRVWAVGRFPHLQAQLGQGMTLADIVNPARSVVARELEVDPSTIDVMNHPEWSKLMSVKDLDTPSGFRVATESEAMTMARSQNQWWQTSNGRKTDSELGSSLLRAFGMRA